MVPQCQRLNRVRVQSVYQLTTKPSEKGSSYSLSSFIRMKKGKGRNKKVKGWLRKRGKEANDGGGGGE